MTELRLAVAVAPRDGRARADLGRLYIRVGRRGGALRELEKARALGARGVDAELGGLYAARARQRAIWRDPDRWADWTRAGTLLGDVPDAYAAFDAGEIRRLAGDPAGGEKLLGRAVLRDVDGLRQARASREAAEAGRVPAGCVGDAAAWRRLEMIVGAGGSEGDRLARDYADGELSLQCRGPALAELYSRNGDFPRARAWMEEVLAEAPTHAGLALQAARLAALAGDWPRAELYLEQAEYWTVGRGRPSLALTRTYLDLGRPVDAMGAARQAIALGDREVREQALLLVVEAAERAGRWDDAKRARAVLEAEGRTKPQ